MLAVLLKTALQLMKNVLQSLAKSISIPLGLTATASGTNAGIHKNILRSRGPLDLVHGQRDLNYANKQQH